MLALRIRSGASAVGRVVVQQRHGDRADRTGEIDLQNPPKARVGLLAIRRLRCYRRQPHLLGSKHEFGRAAPPGGVGGNAAEPAFGPAIAQLRRQDDGIAHERRRAAVPGAEIELAWRAHLRQPSTAQHRHLVGERQSLGLIMGDQDAR